MYEPTVRHFHSGITKSFVARPANEWYSWRPSPGLSKMYAVPVDLDPDAIIRSAIKGLITDGDPDVPVVWPYQLQNALHDMGAGRQGADGRHQNRLIENGILLAC